MFLPLPFASKELPSGKKLFRRKHGYQFTCINGISTHEIVVPYPQAKINEIEILNQGLNCKVNLKVLDTATGTYSTIPNFVLDQFGFNVNLREKFFEDTSQYDADVYMGMRIQLEIDNPNPEFNMGVNIVFHEVK